MLREAEARETPVNLRDMEDEAKVFAGKVMSDLTCLCRESALRVLSQLEGTAEVDNGFEA